MPSYKLTCPICKLEHEAPLFTVIDAGKDKEAREKLISGGFFEFVCPDCGYVTDLRYNCLYVDGDIRELIYIAASGDEPEKDAVRASEGIPFCASGDSLMRIVSTADELREKLLIFENGLDDRLVEVCKGIAISQFPSDDDYYITDIKYDVISEQELLRIKCSDDTEQYVLDFGGFYAEIYDSYAALMPPLRGSAFCRVDLEYAASLLMAAGDNE